VAEASGNGAGNGAVGDGTGEFKTFQGAGFGTMLVRLSAGPKDTPPAASSRAYLRGGLPAIYQESDFGMRFIGGLESLLDPIVAVLDGLPAHFDPDHAPRDILNLLAAWLGVDLDESQELKHQREMVRRAADLGRRRGTVSGIELALELSFPGVPLRVEDQGGVRWSLEDRPVEAPPPSFVVYCDKPVAEETQAAIARCIEQHKPVGTAYRLRVKAPKKKDSSS
jgi:phage tail-like protein